MKAIFPQATAMASKAVEERYKKKKILMSGKIIDPTVNVKVGKSMVQNGTNSPNTILVSIGTKLGRWAKVKM
jgi:hypothetical protein